MTFYRVVVPLDGSRLAEAALEEATGLTNKLGHILLVTAVDNDVPKIGGFPFYPLAGMGMAYLKASQQELYESNLAYLTQMVAKLRAQGFNAEVDIRYGSPAEVIVHAAEDFKADLIVMSSHGRTGFSRQSLGSVAVGVLKSSKRPVFIVHPAEKHNREKAAV
jgi:nucleotide-binding universal stress UspA family protein